MMANISAASTATGSASPCRWNNPLGIGPMVFGTMFPEDEHNIWLKSFTILRLARLRLLCRTLSSGHLISASATFCSIARGSPT